MGIFRGPNIVTDGLVFAVDAGSERSYPGSGTTVTSLVGSNTGTLTNGVAFSTDNGGTWEFDGVDDNIQLGNVSSIKNTTTGTISFIFKTSTTSPKFPWGWWGNTSNYMRMDIRGNGTLAFITEVGNVGNSITSTATSPLDTWTHCDITQDGTNSRMYVNGVLQSGTGNSTWFGTHPTLNLYIAYHLSWGGYDFEGYISTFKIYNKALSQAEITQNFNAQKSRFA